MKRGEMKGSEWERIRVENERLMELRRLPDDQRKTLRRAIIFGQSDYAAAETADCSVHLASVMRARLNSLGLLPPPPARKPMAAKIERDALADKKQLKLFE